MVESTRGPCQVCATEGCRGWIFLSRFKEVDEDMLACKHCGNAFDPPQEALGAIREARAARAAAVIHPVPAGALPGPVAPGLVRPAAPEASAKRELPLSDK
eukprot:2983838-Pyramimonas_sp.AAC.1